MKMTEVVKTPAVFDRETFIKEYAATGKPKCRYIPCTVTGKMITCYSTNLTKKVAKYGSVEALLDGFVSRGAKKAAIIELKVAAASEAVKQHKTETKPELVAAAPKPRKRKSKTETK